MNNELPRIRKESGVFFVEVDKIKPNTFQPRSIFNEDKLNELSESIRQYGVLQPLVVIRREKEVPTGTIIEYEIIAGERRWRASQIAGLTQVPVIIREEPSDQVKLELALIENIQREDLSPIERAVAFKQLVDNFKMRHHEVGLKVGKSREFVSNTIRLLSLPEDMQEGLKAGLIREGHTRPLLSLIKHEDDQKELYKEIIFRKMNVRATEHLAREILKNKTKAKIKLERREDPEAGNLERKLSDALGTRVSVEKKGPVKKISMEFFSEDDLKNFLMKVGAAVVAEGTVPQETGEIEEILTTTDSISEVEPPKEVQPQEKDSLSSEQEPEQEKEKVGDEIKENEEKVDDIPTIVRTEESSMKSWLDKFTL